MKTTNSRSKVWEISNEKFTFLIKNSNSLSEALRKLNLGDRNGNHLTLKKRIMELKIDTSHMNPYVKNNKKRYTLEEILVENSSYKNRTTLKRRLIREGLLVEKCYTCGIGNEWNGIPLVLQLEHKNGINNDNRIDNLALICPNCHSQTSTYAGKNSNKKTLKKLSKRRDKHCIKCNKTVSTDSKSKLCSKCYSNTRRVVDRPSKEMLLNLILTKPFTQIANDYGVSDNAIRKWCKHYNIPFRKKDIEEYTKSHVIIHT